MARRVKKVADSWRTVVLYSCTNDAYYSYFVRRTTIISANDVAWYAAPREGHTCGPDWCACAAGPKATLPAHDSRYICNYDGRTGYRVTCVCRFREPARKCHTAFAAHRFEIWKYYEYYRTNRRQVCLFARIWIRSSTIRHDVVLEMHGKSVFYTQRAPGGWCCLCGKLQQSVTIII